MVKFRVFQHNDHDWRDMTQCDDSGCERYVRVMEANSPQEAVREWFMIHQNVDSETALAFQDVPIKTTQENVYIFDAGEADDESFAFVVERIG